MLPHLRTLRTISRLRTPLAGALLIAQLATPLLVPGLAHAAPVSAAEAGAPKPLSETLTGEAKKNYEVAITLYKVKDYQNATLRFQQAYDETKDPRLLWNMATCQKLLTHYARVQALVSQYVVDGTAQHMLSDADQREATQLLSVIDALVAPLKLEIKEPGATITIDDEVVATSPVKGPLTVDMGTRRLKVTKTDFADFETNLTIQAGKETKVVVNLLKHSHEGRVSIRSSARFSTIQIDGKKLGGAEYFGPVPVGAHLLRVTAPGFEPYQADFSLTENATRTFEVTLKSEKKPIPRWVWIGGSVLLAGGIAAAITGVVIATRPDQCKPSQPTVACPVSTFAPQGTGFTFK